MFIKAILIAGLFVALSGGERREIPMDDTGYLVRIRYQVPVWGQGETLILKEGCEDGTQLHNAGFFVSDAVRSQIQLTNSRLIIVQRDGQKLWFWSWYLRNNGKEVKDQEVEVSFNCIMH